MDCSKLTANNIYKINVWDTQVRPPGWKKLPAVYLGEEAGWVRFLVNADAQYQTDIQDETLAGFAVRQERWSVYSDHADHIIEKAGFFQFVNTLGLKKNSFMKDSEEAKRFEKIAKQAGLKT